MCGFVSVVRAAGCGLWWGDHVRGVKPLPFLRGPFSFVFAELQNRLYCRVCCVCFVRWSAAVQASLSNGPAFNAVLQQHLKSAAFPCPVSGFVAKGEADLGLVHCMHAWQRRRLGCGPLHACVSAADGDMLVLPWPLDVLVTVCVCVCVCVCRGPCVGTPGTEATASPDPQMLLRA